MKTENLDLLRESGEGSSLEFKSKVKNPEQIIDTITAFANSSGGTILVGVDDEGSKLNLSESTLIRYKETVKAASDLCEPSVNVETSIVGKVLVVEVPQSESIVRSKEGYFTREGSMNLKMKRGEIIKALQYKEDKFEEIICEDFKYEENFDEEVFQDYLKLSGINLKFNQEKTLRNLGAARKTNERTKFTNAGVLFFGKRPSRFIESHQIICRKYKSAKGIETSKTIEDPIIPAIRKAKDFVAKSSSNNYTGEIIREAITNSVAHRDYQSSRPIEIEVHPNSTVIRNPGGMPEDMSLDKLGELSIRRNPTIADMLDRAGFAERMGTGILRMRKISEMENLPSPEFRVTSDTFEIILSENLSN